MRKACSAPFCIWAGQRRGSLSDLLQKWKQEVCGRAGNRSHITVLDHVHDPRPPPGYLLRWGDALQCFKGHPIAPWGFRQEQARVPTVGRSGEPPGQAAHQQWGWHPEATGSVITNKPGVRSMSCRGGSTAAVLGMAGCPRSSTTSPLLAILGYCPASEAERKIASSTAAPFSTTSPLLLTRVTNITGQVTQNANISG